MRKLSGILILLVFATMADAQITQTATFDNFASNQSFNTSFTDLSSGITFENPTGVPNGFSIDSDPFKFFNGSNYLTSGGSGGFGFQFGFTGAIPQAANRISADVFEDGAASGVTLKGFDSTGVLVAEEQGTSSIGHVFNLEIDSSKYNITSFQFSVTSRATGYDNVSYTILPEPSSFAVLAGFVAFWRRERR